MNTSIVLVVAHSFRAKSELIDVAVMLTSRVPLLAYFVTVVHEHETNVVFSCLCTNVYQPQLYADRYIHTSFHLFHGGHFVMIQHLSQNMQM